MKAKEKANHLIWGYLPIIEGWTGNEKTVLAKKCASICVDEIERHIQRSTPIDDPYANLAALEYWAEVKTEIEKL